MRMSFDLAECRFHQRYKLLMVYVAGCTYHNPIWMVAKLQVPQDHLSGEALNRSRVTENGSAQGIPIPECLVEENVNVVIGCILHHVDFLEDHLALPLYFTIIEDGVKEDIRKDIHNQGQMGIQDLGVETGILLAGKRIGHASDSVELFGYILSTPLFCPFEEHMLNEVGQAALALLFIARAYVQPYAHRD
jgi:hypothetical protein